MEIIIIIALVLLNGVFAMSELSLVSSRKFKLEAAKKKGSSGAKAALDLSENPGKFLSTVQIGITLIGILLGVYSGENLTTEVTDFLLQFDILKPYAKNLAVGIIVVFITYLSIVLGELFPKRLGMTFPEPIAMFMAKPMKILSMITSPFVWILTSSNDLLLTIFGVKKSTESKVSEEEIKAIIKESAEGGEIQDIEQDIVERVFELGDRNVNSLYTHSSDIVYLDTNDTWDEIKAKINQEKHSAYPVVKNNDLDDILGIVLLKDLFYPTTDAAFDITTYLKKPVYINEDTSAFKVLELFKVEKIHYGIVIDEYGTTIGIVTMDDVLDALIGDATEIDQDEYQILQRNENSWLVDGQYPIVPFLRYFELNVDEFYQGKFSTVAGLVMNRSIRIPEIGDKIIISDLVVEVIDKDGQRIDKIMVSRMEKND
ncbi:hemolysin family protein [Cognataquiflexum rubidum]|uniref:hemolysin family protein n=1 Tax=Cognataquiflexum rubidum TaxID=2922273 RepID=UPI001F12C53A|nr:hemolysin family protein [Cognataquiflexum rubidum]MCH6233770.1 hemolysin family protein [Cognataquiflexum rubidum]